MHPRTKGAFIIISVILENKKGVELKIRLEKLILRQLHFNLFLNIKSFILNNIMFD
ncbi:hypothetical protein QIQ_1125 [Clostridioides difficile DA00130]|nr:hypothetical protein HMPREF9945_02206 [Clostridioides difficile 70-100-2010]EQG01397.1 hypothetical protein QGY_1121 [Clostridioides difficile 840]EQG99033.1 hypothetical protein QKI_1246 [Clostridioides difficile DA00189]EQH55927.1 hypothetical protein QMC_1118 [Clostridioides difficile DA00245]EQH74479.1 hypothetical protein QMG_1076 [Clostridioides difficile DA00256]EQI86031.1 hypothetical protein QQI_1051 [Clostridioides difficile Y401]ERM33100.1 hypothetical protein QIQ_1125 [Clostrid